MTDQKNTTADDSELDESLVWARRSKAKRHQLLTDIQIGLRGCHKTQVFEVFGTWYELRTLDPLDEDWTLQYIKGHDIFAAGKSRRAPVVAAALVRVGKAEHELLPVEELFELPEDMGAVDRRLIESSEEFRRGWVRTEVLRWLCEPDGHETLIATLYDRYLQLEKARNEALGALSPLSKSDRTGGSSSTSSLAKESSSATPASPG